MREMPDHLFEDRKTFEMACQRRGFTHVLDGVVLYIDPEDGSLGAHLIRDGYWEAWVSLAIARVIKPGWVCVDAGAHCGYYTALMSRRGASIVTAFEPQPSLARLIRRTVESNKLMLHTNVEVREYALSDIEGSASLQLYGHLSGSASLGPVPDLTPTGELAVRTITMDKATAYFTRLNLVKIDCEGAEEKIWRGMARTRFRFPEAIIVMEIGAGRGYDVAEFLATIEKEYPLRVVNRDGDIEPKTIEQVVESTDLTTLWLSRTP